MLEIKFFRGAALLAPPPELRRPPNFSLIEAIHTQPQFQRRTRLVSLFQIVPPTSEPEPLQRVTKGAVQSVERQTSLWHRRLAELHRDIESSLDVQV